MNEITTLEKIYEVLGESVFEMLSAEEDVSENPQDPTLNPIVMEIGNFLELAHNSYILVQWPDSQEYMDEDWFALEAILDHEAKFGQHSAYFIPLKRIIK